MLGEGVGLGSFVARRRNGEVKTCTTVSPNCCNGARRVASGVAAGVGLGVGDGLGEASFEALFLRRGFLSSLDFAAVL